MRLEARDIIKRPIVTEKTVENTAFSHYTFEVYPTANKFQIKKAVEEIFSVNVLKVNTINVKGKKRRFGKTLGKTKDWKKAIVTLKDGQKIEIGGVNYFEH